MLRLRALSIALAGTLTLACGKNEAPSSEPASAPVEASQPAATASTPAPATTTTAAPAAAVPAVAAPAGIATAEGEQGGVTATVTELKRASGGTVTLKFTIVNNSDGEVGFGYHFADPDHNITDYGTIGGVQLIDPVGKKKYFVARDSENKCVCSRNVKDVKKGSSANVWAKFPAPPDDVKKISIVIPHFSPVDDAPISE